MRVVRALALALALSASAYGGDEPPNPPPAPPAPAAPPAPPAPSARVATPQQAADAVLAAITAKDEVALKALAAKDAPDAWIVADELVLRGELDAADAFAKAAPRVDLEALPAYVASRRGRPDDPVRRERLAQAHQALATGKPGDALEAVGPKEAGPLVDVVGVRLALGRAVALRSLGRPDASAAAFLSAGEAAERIGWLAPAARALHESCGMAFAVGAFAVAKQAATRALVVDERRGDKAAAAVALRDLGRTLYRIGAHAEALGVHERALAAQEELGNKGDAAWSLNSIGLAHAALRDHAKALSFYERAIQAHEALGDKAGVAAALGNIGLVHQDLRDYPKALAFQERALEAKEALGNGADTAATLVNIGTLHADLQDFPKALEFFERGLALAESVGHRRWAANALRGMGGVHLAVGSYPKALSANERALQMLEAIGDRIGAAQVLSSIGNVQYALGDLAKALSTYERALAAKEALGDREGAAISLGNVGIVHAGLGDLAKALSTFERALALHEALGQKDLVASTLGSLANVHQALGDSARAIAFGERALRAQEALGDKSGVARTLGNLGSVYGSLGDQAKALALHERALAAQEALGDKSGVAHTLGSIGMDHHRLGRYAEALSFHERSLAALEALGDKAGVAHALGNVGFELLTLGELAKASTYLERAARSARRLRAVPVLVLTLTRLARLHLAQGASGRALSEAREALRESETLLGGLGDEEGAYARARHAELYELGTLAAVHQGDLGAAFEFLENGRAGAALDSLDKRDMLRWKAESLPQELRAAEAEARAEEGRARAAHEKALAGGDRAAIAAAARALDDALEGARAVHARIQRETKRAADLFYPRARTLEDVQATLEDGEALVLYGLCLDHALALVVGREEARVVALGGRAEVEAASEAFDARSPQTDPSPALAALEKMLIEPLGLQESVKRVVVSPAGRLALLPFGALFDVPVAVTPSGSTQTLLLEEERERGEGILALGDPDYGGATEGTQRLLHRGRPLTALPATRGEVEAIATAGTLLGAKASEAGLREALGAGKRWRAVHFACHGLVDGKRPFQSSLALTRAGDDDGFLTAQEVLSMQIPSDLVTLSACETATGEVVSGEGIVGLTRAFMYAGTPRVICSLWKVDDEATSALMVKFYELWNPRAQPGDAEPAERVEGAEGLSAAAALKQAQAYVRSQEKWKHPYYWAAWVLWGLPD